jgi:hypothetical protein
VITSVYLLQEFCKGRSPEAAINSIEEAVKELRALPDSDLFQICHIISGKKTRRTNLLSPSKFKPLILEENKNLLASPNEHNFSDSLYYLEQYIVKDQKKHKSNEVAKPVLCVFTDNPDADLVFDAVRFRYGEDCLLSKIILVYHHSEAPTEGIFDKQIEQQDFCSDVENIIRDRSSEEAGFTEVKRNTPEMYGEFDGPYTFDSNSEPLGGAGEKVVFNVAQGRKRLALGLYTTQRQDDQNNSQSSKLIGSKREERIKRLKAIIEIRKQIEKKYSKERTNPICWPLDIIDDCNDDKLHSELKTLQKQLEPKYKLHKLPKKKILGVIMPLIPDNFYFKKQSKNVPKKLQFMLNPEHRKTHADPDLASRWQKHSTLMSRWTMCGNLVRAISLFDAEGLRHTDLSAKNVLVDKEDIYIIDIDSCHPADRLDRAAVRGTKQFMAPELILRKELVPTVDSDRFALAKLIYGVLMIDESDVEGAPSSQLYDGTNLKPDHHDLLRFGRGGKTIYKMFDKAFIKGWDKPDKRPSAREWGKVFNSKAEQNKFNLTWMVRRDSQADERQRLKTGTSKKLP